MLQFTTVIPFTLLRGDYKCFYCDEKFTELRPALQHTKTHMVPNQSTLLCNYIKRGKRAITVDVSELKCRICELKYSKLYDIRQHLITAHKKLFYDKDGNGMMAYNLSTPSGQVACYTCSKEFTSFISLNRHMNIHDNLICATCGLGFLTHQRLKSHMITHQDGNYKCKICQKVFPTTLKLRYHTDKYHEQENEKKQKCHKCPQCLERFFGHYSKMTHLREVHGITFKFECQTCHAVFPNKLALTRHTTQVHIQNIVCKICGKCYGAPSKLRIHMRWHTGERNFVCATCPKSYKHGRELRVHIKKTHGYEFACFKCGTGYSDKAVLSEHKKQEHAKQSRSKTTLV